MPEAPTLPALASCADSSLWAGYHSGKEAGRGWRQGLTEGWPLLPVTTSPSPPACQPGRYGKRCVPCKCANHSSCHPSNGTCYCLAGWTGPDCSQRTWRPVCLSACRGDGLRTKSFHSPEPGYKSLWTHLDPAIDINTISRYLLGITYMLGIVLDAQGAAMNRSGEKSSLPFCMGKMGKP